MTAPAFAPGGFHAHERRTSGGELRSPNAVWMYDPWCVTPWYTAALTGALLDEGIGVRLVSPRYHLEPTYFQEQGLDTRPGPFDLSTRIGLRPAGLRQCLRLGEYLANSVILAAQAKLRPPRILHLQQCALLNRGWQTELTFLRWCRKNGVRLLCTIHNLLPHDRRSFHAELYAKLYQIPDMLLCHSPDAAEALEREFRIAPDRIRMVPHGPLFAAGSGKSQAECRTLLGIESGRTMVLAQGVLADYKGIDLLLDAWAGMIERDAGKLPPLLVIAGRGKPAEMQVLRHRVASLRLQQSVRLDLRYLSARELPLYFDASDVLVYPYKAITTSGALLTGLNYCKPIIASDLPPFRPYLVHGLNALRVPPGDTLALASALESFCFNPQLRRQLAKGSRNNRRLQTQWSEIGARTAAIYRSLCI